MTIERKINGKILYELRPEYIKKYDANSIFYTISKNKIGKYILEFQHDINPLNVYFPNMGSFQKNFMLRLFKLYSFDIMGSSACEIAMVKNDGNNINGIT